MRLTTKTILSFTLCLFFALSLVPPVVVFANVVTGAVNSTTQVDADTTVGQTVPEQPPERAQSSADGAQSDAQPPAGTNDPDTQTNTKTETGVNLTIAGTVNRLTGILDRIIPFIIGLTVFFIIWKILSYIGSAGNEEKLAEAKRFIIWGVIGVFCMLSLWGFVNLLLNSFMLQSDIRPTDIPTVPTVNPL